LPQVGTLEKIGRFEAIYERLRGMCVGKQTLGEEYCELYRVHMKDDVGGGVQLVDAKFKTIWLLIDIVMPYLQQRSALGWSNMVPVDQRRRLQEARQRARARAAMVAQGETVVSMPTRNNNDRHT